MSIVKPISPAGALEKTGEMPPDYVILAINDVICALIADNPNRAYAGFTVDYDVIDTAVHRAYQKLNYAPQDDGQEWKRFPVVFGEYWDIEVHGKKDAYTGAWRFDYYTFRPRGCRLIRDNDTD